MPQLQAPQQPANANIDDLHNRMPAAVLETLFRAINLADPSLGRRVDYLRGIIRESEACNRNYDGLVASLAAAGVTVGRRNAFRAGCCLGLLMSEYLPLWR